MRESPPPRVVFDTNVVLSALVFPAGRMSFLRGLWQAGRCTPLVSSTTAGELVRALGYPKFKLTPALQEELLADYLPYGRTVRMPAKPPAVPACRDANDQPSLALAAVGKADFLVTGDRDLLVLSDAFGGRIVTADAFRERAGPV